MKKSATLTVLLALLTTARAGTILFDLSPPGIDRAIGMAGANETPPVASLATGNEIGSGIVFDDTTLALTLHVGYGSVLGFTDLSADFVADHIHTAPPGQPGPIIIDLAPLTLQVGTRAGIISGSVTLTPAQAADLVAGHDYINVHSTAFPAGEIRAQIIPVPEPQHVTVMTLLGFLLLGAVQTFRRKG